MTENILLAFGLTLFAGLSTGIGSAIALLAKRTNKVFLSVSLGFSAGVMIYVAMIEIFAKAKDSLVAELGSREGYWLTVIGFFSGILLIAIIDKLIPKDENPHEVKMLAHEKENPKKLMKIGLFAALAIAIHNFPEGLATFTSVINNPQLGLVIAVAIAIHNIPEGIAVSVPIYYATGNKKKAFWLSFLSGLSEPIGALIGYLILLPIMTPIIFGFLFSAVAGIMVFISLDELLPAAREYGEHHWSIYGLILGMAVMALSLLLFV